MSKLYTTDGKILSDDFPELKIGDKCYRVDTRKSTYDKMQTEMEKENKKAKGKGEDELILEYCLGEDAAREITAMDLTISGYSNLVTYIYAAMFDISFEEAVERFQKTQQS